MTSVGVERVVMTPVKGGGGIRRESIEAGFFPIQVKKKALGQRPMH